MREFIVQTITQLTEGIREFTLAPADGRAPGAHDAGAHVDFDLSGVGLRSYSLIDLPGDAPGTTRVAVQREDAGQGGSRAMHALAEGDHVPVADPVNDFPLAGGAAPVLLLAGGIGVTPLIAMATALQVAGHPFALHYTGRTAARMAYRDALAQTFGATLYADDDNPLDLKGLMAAHADHAVYICGPRPMIDAARAAAEAAGIAPADIHVELFTAAAPAAGDAPFEVEVSSTGQVFTVPPGKTIVEVLEEGGVDVMYDCQRGDCGICQTTVLSGTPDHRDVVLSEAERASGTVMQICVSRAKSARLVLDL